MPLNFDLNRLMQDPNFVSGINLLAGSSPRMQPLQQAYEALRQMDKQKQEQAERKQMMEFRRVQADQDKRRSDLYEVQTRQQQRALDQAERDQEFVTRYKERLLNPQAQQSPAQMQPQPTAPTQPPMPVGKYGTPARLLDNLLQVESSGNPLAIGPDIGNGEKAQGAYQFLPSTTRMLRNKGLAFDPFKPLEARDAADFYIQDLLKQHGGDYSKAMAAYGGFKSKDPTKYVSRVLDGTPETQARTQQQLQQQSQLPDHKLLGILGAKTMAELAAATKPDYEGQRLLESQQQHAAENARATETAQRAAEAAARDQTRLQHELNKPPKGYTRTPSGELKPDLTAEEGKATAYFSQMVDAQKTFEELAKQGWDPNKTVNQIGTLLAGGITNPAATALQQQAKQAQEQWAEAYLRFKTGAATNADEISRNVRTFFPEIGDKKEAVARKATARKNVEKAIVIAAGRGPDELPKNPTKERTIVRQYKGAKSGKTVIEYSDGTSEYGR